MRCGSSPTDVVVVHAWKIVMHQRVGVNDLDGCRETGCITRASRRAVRRKKEHSAQSFSTALERISDWIGDRRRKVCQALPRYRSECNLNRIAKLCGQCAPDARR